MLFVTDHLELEHLPRFAHLHINATTPIAAQELIKRRQGDVRYSVQDDNLARAIHDQILVHIPVLDYVPVYYAGDTVLLVKFNVNHDPRWWVMAVEG